MPPSAIMIGTTWCLSCLSTEMETTSCPAKLLDMNMPTCWILVTIHSIAFPVTYHQVCIKNFSFFTTGQWFVQEFLMPYFQQARDIWQWLLGAGILGALAATIIGVLLILFRRKLKRNQRRKRASNYGERQPLLQSSSEEGSSSYQTTL